MKTRTRYQNAVIDLESALANIELCKIEDDYEEAAAALSHAAIKMALSDLKKAMDIRGEFQEADDGE